MKDIRSIHRSAIQLAKEANACLENGDRSGFFKKGSEALILEKEAALELISDFESEPTRSVLFRSAASLAFNLGLFDESNKMIHLALAGNPYPEIQSELLFLQEKITSAENSLQKEEIGLANAYLSLLQTKAVNFRLTPKEQKYSHAIVLDYIVDFLKNIQTSFLNFTEVNFRKFFSYQDFTDYDKILTLFKKDTKALCVNLHFASFGVSISADTRIMNYTSLNYEKLDSFKNALFEDFKSEVLLADYNSNNYLETVKSKYDPTERSQIFSPIVNALKDQSKYKIDVYNSNFSATIKSLPPLKNEAIEVLKPSTETSPNEDEEVLLKRTYELTTTQGKKKGTLISEQFDYGEMSVTLREVKSGERVGYFINPYLIKIIFDHGNFLIDDTYYNIYVEDNDYSDLLQKYSNAVVNKFEYLLNVSEDKITFDELEILDRIKSSIIKGW